MENIFKISLIYPAESIKDALLDIEFVSKSLINSLSKILNKNVETEIITPKNLSVITRDHKSDFYLIFAPSNRSQILSTIDIFSLKDKSFLIFAHENEKKNVISHLEGFRYFDLFDIESVNNRVRCYRPDIQGNESQLFWLKILDISYEISMKVTKRNIKQEIFISEYSKDVSEYYDSLVRNLKSLDFGIVPEYRYSLEIPQNQLFVKSKLNIFIAGKYMKNNIWLNNLKYSLTLNNVETIVWIPYGMKIDDYALTDIFNKIILQNTANASVLQMPFEDLKKMVFEKLEIVENKNSIKSSIDFEKSIYIIHDMKDNGKIKQISNDLKNKKITPLFIDFATQSHNLVEIHREYLVQADTILIYDNNCSDKWIESKIKDLMKSPGYGRQKPLKAKVILTLNPEKIKNKKFVDQTFQIATMTDNFNSIDFNIN